MLYLLFHTKNLSGVCSGVLLIEYDVGFVIAINISKERLGIVIQRNVRHLDGSLRKLTCSTF